MQETNKGMAMQLFEIVIQLGLHVYVICILQNQYCMAIDTSFAIWYINTVYTINKWVFKKLSLQ